MNCGMDRTLYQHTNTQLQHTYYFREDGCIPLIGMDSVELGVADLEVEKISGLSFASVYPQIKVQPFVRDVDFNPVTWNGQYGQPDLLQLVDVNGLNVPNSVRHGALLMERIYNSIFTTVSTYSLLYISKHMILLLLL